MNFESIVKKLNEKYQQDFFPFHSRWFNQIFAWNKVVCNIFPREYDLENYQNNYDRFSLVHKNIAKILEWNFDDNYFVQEKIINSVDDWTSDENIELFFSQYLQNIFQNKRDFSIDIWEIYIKKIYKIFVQQKDKSDKKILADLINQIQKNNDDFHIDYSCVIHGDLSDSNILWNSKDFYIIDFENVSNFDIYYDLVSFDYFVQKDNSEIYKNIFEKNKIHFSQKRYEINKDFFTFIHNNDLWNLI